MPFDSGWFLIFFAAVWSASLFLPWRQQNLLLLGASYLFYGLWNWRFVPVLLVSTWIGYVCGLKVQGASSRKTARRFLFAGVGAELLLLGVFKVGAGVSSLGLLFPLGISYYTFQAISYAVDVHRRKVTACRSFLDFALFKSFFPILLGGPIERAGNLLVQIQARRSIDSKKLEEGLFLFSWGLFQKVFIADGLARVVDQVYATPSRQGGFALWIGVYAFAIELYANFSGYSDMARGLGKWLGFDLVRNFDRPYLAVTPQQFWRRWHMSLSSWLFEYVCEPLTLKTRSLYLALFLTFVVNGIWHGTGWNFVLLGAFNGIVFCAYVLAEPYVKPGLLKADPAARRFASILGWFVMFHLTCLGFVFFRAESVPQAIEVFTGLLRPAGAGGTALFRDLVFFALPLVGMEWLQSVKGGAVAYTGLPRRLRFAVSVAAILLAGAALQGDPRGYIYFRF